MKVKSSTIILTTAAAAHTSGLMSGWVMTFSGSLVAPSQAALWCMDTVLLELSKYNFIQ